MKEIWTGRVGQVAAKYGEHAPMATVCCNACRSCFTANALAAVTGGIAAIGLRLRRRFAKGS